MVSDDERDRKAKNLPDDLLEQIIPMDELQRQVESKERQLRDLRERFGVGKERDNDGE